MVLKCLQCEYEVEMAVGLKIHVTKVHSTKSKVLCKFCHKTFASRQSLCTHMKKHKKEEIALKNEKQAQVVVHSDSAKELVEEICSLKKQIQKLDTFIQNNNTTLQTELTTKNKKADSIGYIYLLQLREFVKTNEDIYKVGMTSQENEGRFRGYPKGSVLLFQDSCENFKEAEKQILKKFKTSFTQMTDIGTEYFKGDLRQMKDIVHTIVNSVR